MKLARIALVLGLALLAACSDAPTARDTSSPTPSSTPAPGMRQIAYVTTQLDGTRTADQLDLWLYDVAGDTTTRLTNDGKSRIESLPRFHGSLVTYVEDGRKLIEIDPATRTRKVILSVAGRILATAWYRDEVAFIENDDGTHRLRVRDTVAGSTRTIETLGTPEGRGTGLDDALTLAWNRGGTQILVTDTHVDADATVRVLRRDGSDVTTPVRNASNALWSHDERSIYLRDLRDGAKPLWQRLDLVRGARETLALDGGTHHGTLSADGGRLAGVRGTGDDTNDVVIEILDLSDGTTTQAAPGTRDPIWLSADSFAATRSDDCPENDDACLYFGFRGAGTVLQRLGSQMKPISLGTTLWDGLGSMSTDVRIG